MKDNAVTARERWETLLGKPENYSFEPGSVLVRQYRFDDFDAEVYWQNNGPGTRQQLVKVFPKTMNGKVPAVAVPFYFPEGMIGFELDSGKVFTRYSKIRFMVDLARRGIASASAESYHLTYIRSDLDRLDFARWSVAGGALTREHPAWTGIGKLVADTRLVIDALAADDRVDADRLGIAGHSLGGKMAFYTGMLDDRIKVVMASDFGIIWEQTNWQDIWYWGRKLADLKAQGVDHRLLLQAGGGKPFFLIAGQYDDAASVDFVRQSGVYDDAPEHFQVFHHGTGHNPTPESLTAAYDFMERVLKQ